MADDPTQDATAVKKYGIAVKALRRICQNGCWRHRTSIKAGACDKRGIHERQWCEPCIAVKTLKELGESV